MLTEYTRDDAAEALHWIDAGCNRDDWHKIGRAAIAAGLSVDDLDTWSATAGNYAGSQDVKAAFRTITPEGGTGPGTLFRLAKEHGWTPTGTPRQAPNKAAKRSTEPPRKPAPGMAAADVWSRCLPATAAHGYIVSKGAVSVPLDALRVLADDDPLQIMGESMAGSLVVPCVATDGTLSTLQLIPPPDVAQRLKAAGKPGKLNLPGCKVEGWFTVGKIERLVWGICG